METEDATEEEREGEVIWSERKKRKGEGDDSEEGKDKGIKKKKKYEMHIGLMIRIKIDEIGEMKKGNNEWSTVI